GFEDFHTIFSSNEQFLIQKDKKIRFLVANASLCDFLFKVLANVHSFIYSIGTCLALFNRLEGPCKITLEGLHLIAPYARKKIRLDSDETLKFLYGRPFHLKGDNSQLNVNRNEKSLVFDQFDRVLGIGVIEEDFRLVPVIDLGYYLRQKLK
ncbi:MAG: hypothetical protein ACFFBD_22745, partial [Candidatus Hodarchaeota archaeon]